ncbi:MAG: cation:proton antiporter [Thalassolituus sp.]|jgi:Kef-type K+ transport system membrane component KefB|uniref:cation:proton antiporter n=1 Tax=unclassified Thalassolituus TaxID=2624967 RepID=UPI000C0FB3A9|nr:MULTISPECIES: cation:proton antiporter [unclassified Thalassolituus]MBN58383.1 sodium:proton antiporter [Oceanospirillaceae bacterium]MDQ4424393.1 cation:proton antiporter [Thalassolituus sp.]MDQ4427070.1 cation:proton antiporter [Thalassolituus sp.]|tara:strand:+ start:16227 stop:17387 length:1161 start_codon:yes stop_codon:yes gene_type:complete
MPQDIVFSFFLIFAGALVLATFALYTRQPILVAYIALGAIAGPYGMGWIEHPDELTDMAHIGIIFLLFLLGLDMQPSSLFAVLKKAMSVALLSSLVFFGIGAGITHLLGYGMMDAVIVGLACMFSSTIIGLKLLPTTVLHHKHSGELMVGLLLIQDMIAILTLILLGVMSGDSEHPVWQPFIALPILAGGCYLIVKYLLLPLIQRFDRYQEYLFIMAIGWCLAVAEGAAYVGLSEEIGAFIAGVTLATSPIAQFMAISLKPLRDFFLVMFFFTLGAGVNLGMLEDVLLGAALLAAAVLILKPLTFRLLLGRFSETPRLAWDVGFRLGQISEFSLLVVFVAIESALLSERASLLVQATAIMTFVLSSYIVVFNYPNPIAISDRLRRD